MIFIAASSIGKKQEVSMFTSGIGTLFSVAVYKYLSIHHLSGHIVKIFCGRFRDVHYSDNTILRPLLKYPSSIKVVFYRYVGLGHVAKTPMKMFKPIGFDI